MREHDGEVPPRPGADPASVASLLWCGRSYGVLKEFRHSQGTHVSFEPARQYVLHPLATAITTAGRILFIRPDQAAHHGTTVEPGGASELWEALATCIYGRDLLARTGIAPQNVTLGSVKTDANGRAIFSGLAIGAPGSTTWTSWPQGTPSTVHIDVGAAP